MKKCRENCGGLKSKIRGYVTNRYGFLGESMETGTKEAFIDNVVEAVYKPMRQLGMRNCMCGSGIEEWVDKEIKANFYARYKDQSCKGCEFNDICSNKMLESRDANFDYCSAWEPSSGYKKTGYSYKHTRVMNGKES